MHIKFAAWHLDAPAEKQPPEFFWTSFVAMESMDGVKQVA